MIEFTVDTHPGHRGRPVVGLVRVLLYCCISGSKTHLFRSKKGASGKDDINTLAALKSACWVSSVRCRPTDGQHGKVRRLRVSEPHREQREPGHFQQTTKEVL